MRFLSFRFATLASAILIFTGCAGAQEWQPLVKGDSLEGWVKRGGNATYEAKDGMIIGRTAPGKQNTFLCTEKTYGDFDLELEFKVDPQLNSGVQIRSESKPDYKEGRVHGYQAEIDPSPRSWTGGIYDEGRRGKYLADLSQNEEARKAFKQGEWNKLFISARGNTIRTRINDVDAVEVKDDMTSRGFIALQVHAVPSTQTETLEVRFRNVRIQDWDHVKDSTWESSSPFGDYEGKFADGKPLVAMVWDKGDGQFHTVFKDSFESKDIISETDGALEKSPESPLVGEIPDRGAFELKPVQRKSPTLGAKAPEGATVLFDGTSLDNWQTVDGRPSLWKIAENGAMEVVSQKKHTNHETKQGFGDMELHLEFRTSLMPYARGQQRANSGVYIQGSYEVQVLDSYALGGKDNECGGIYKVGAPAVNMAYPPLQWQTYDISFKAAKWDGDKKTENARITVKHNGVVIHDNIELPEATGGAKYKGEPNHPAPLVLQDHGDKIQFRNIWVK